MDSSMTVTMTVSGLPTSAESTASALQGFDNAPSPPHEDEDVSADASIDTLSAAVPTPPDNGNFDETAHEVVAAPPPIDKGDDSVSFDRLDAPSPPESPEGDGIMSESLGEDLEPPPIEGTVEEVSFGEDTITSDELPLPPDLPNNDDELDSGAEPPSQAEVRASKSEKASQKKKK